VSKLQAVRKPGVGPQGRTFSRPGGVHSLTGWASTAAQHRALDALGRPPRSPPTTGPGGVHDLRPPYGPAELLGGTYSKCTLADGTTLTRCSRLLATGAAAPSRAFQGLLPPVCIAVGGRSDRLIRSLWGAGGRHALGYHSRAGARPRRPPGGWGSASPCTPLMAGADGLHSNEPWSSPGCTGGLTGGGLARQLRCWCAHEVGGRMEQRMGSEPRMLWAAGVKAECYFQWLTLL